MSVCDSCIKLCDMRDVAYPENMTQCLDLLTSKKLRDHLLELAEYYDHTSLCHPSYSDGKASAYWHVLEILGDERGWENRGSMKEPRRCPFCGDIPLLKHSACDSRYAYICHTCSSERLVQTKWYKTKEEALEAWNRRAE